MITDERKEHIKSLLHIPIDEDVEFYPNVATTA